MSKKKEIFYFFVLFSGLFIFFVGLFNTYFVRYILPKDVIIDNYFWLIGIGIFFILVGLILLFFTKIKIVNKYKNFKLFETILLTLLIVVSTSAGAWIFGHYQKTLLISSKNMQRLEESLGMWDQMERDSPFYSKKIIVRDDDIGSYNYFASLEWISNLCKKKDIKVVFAVITAELVNNSELVDYLNVLDREHFEFAPHGFEHIHLIGLPLKQQVAIIENATKVMNEYLNYEPSTFVPPQARGDVNTTKALRLLGYHSITDMFDYPSYVVNFFTDFGYDPPLHRGFDEFKNSFNDFYNSTDEYYMIVLHPGTYLDDNGTPDIKITKTFEDIIDYIKDKNTQFMTIEECYQWYIDESIINTGMVNEFKYFIDLKECHYNHSIKFNIPQNWNGNTYVQEATTGIVTTYQQRDFFHFEGEKGHLYEIYTE